MDATQAKHPRLSLRRKEHGVPGGCVCVRGREWGRQTERCGETV